MTRKIIFIVSILLSSFLTNAQLVVNQTSASQAVSTLLGNGVVASNITFNGSQVQIGTFNGAASNIGLTSGIIIATGDINVAVGPNNAQGMTIPAGGLQGPGDPNLTALFGGTFQTTDAAVLEFDFVPNGDTIQFNYVFGSEEYNEYVCGGVNDVFGFFLSGPNPLGGNYVSKNLAIVPGTVSTPVCINTVNNGNVGWSGTASNCSNIDPNWASYSTYFVDNDTPPGSTVQFDGFTTVLRVKAYVVCGQTYHIKMAIADGGDGYPDASWDSGVFLEAGSFSGSADIVEMNSNYNIVGNDSILYEGCGEALFDFIRANSTDTSVFHYQLIGTASIADYTLSADSIMFLPGEDTVTISFQAILDGLTEPMESVTIEFTQTICSITDTQRVTFYIADYPALTVTPHDTTIACGNTNAVPLWVDVTGPAYNILWNTGETTDTIWVTTTVDTAFYVTVYDTCGVFTINDSVIVTVYPPLPFNITVSDDVTKYCPQDSVQIYANASIVGGNYSYTWNNGIGLGDSVYVNPLITTTYIVEVEDICGTIVIDSVIIHVPNFVPLTNTVTTNDTLICSGEAVILNANINGGVGTYLSWNNGAGQTVPTTVNPTNTTTYILTALDSCGAIVRDSVKVTVNSSPIQVSVSDVTKICLNDIVTLTANIIGGSTSTTILWNTGDTTQSIIVNPASTINYSVIIAEACYSATDTATVVVPVFADLTLNINNDTILNCPSENVILSANISGGSQSPLVVKWTDGTTVLMGNNIIVRPESSTTYTAWIIDSCALDGDTASFTITVPTYAPLSLTNSNDTLVCIGDSITLFANASGGQGTYNYYWQGIATDTIQFQANHTSNYTVVVVDGCGKQVSDVVTITTSKPHAEFTAEYISANEVQFTDLSYADIVNNWWSFNPSDSTLELAPTYTYLTNGKQEVWLIVKNIDGCYDTAYQTIIPPEFIYVPNVFTPDGDGINDLFYIVGINLIKVEFSIYNRWGNLLFESKDQTIGWNGKLSSGENAADGVYIYKLNYSYLDKNGVEFTENGMGRITLIR